MLKASKFIVCVLVLGFFSQNLSAQNNRFNEKKYIFLLDITKSMFGCCGAPDIFDEVRAHLITAIENINDPKTEIVISTYQQQIFDTWKVKATPAGKKELIDNLKKINRNNVAGQETNILGAWNEAKSHLDKDKINIAFILSDGEHTDPGVPIQRFYDEIPRWKEISSKQQAYMFIVELTSLAIDEKVRKIVAETKDVQIINGIEFFVLEINESNPIINIEDELSFQLDLNKDNWNSEYNSLPLSLRIESDHFDLDTKDLKFSSLPLKVKLIPKRSLEENKRNLDTVSFLTVKVEYDTKQFPQIKILNNTIKIQINNKKEKVLKLEVVK